MILAEKQKTIVRAKDGLVKACYASVLGPIHLGMAIFPTKLRPALERGAVLMKRRRRLCWTAKVEHVCHRATPRQYVRFRG